MEKIFKLRPSSKAWNWGKVQDSDPIEKVGLENFLNFENYEGRKIGKNLEVCDGRDFEFKLYKKSDFGGYVSFEFSVSCRSWKIFKFEARLTYRRILDFELCVVLWLYFGRRVVNIFGTWFVILSQKNSGIRRCFNSQPYWLSNGHSFEMLGNYVLFIM